MRKYLAATTLMIVLATATATASSAAVATQPPVTPVSSINVSRYLGKWYQTAAIPAIYEAICAKDDTANYTLAADGNISVANNCTTRSGGNYQVTGEGRPDNPPNDSTLSVSFLDVFGLKFFPATPNYDIIGLSPRYRWAVVVSPDRRSGFILSRTPALTVRQIAATQSVLVANGINPCRLRVTVQDGGAAAAVPYCVAPSAAS